MAEFTVSELADQAGARDLDRECTNVDLLDLHKFFDPWELIGQHLKLTRSQISAVDGDHKTTDQKRLGVLQKWKEIFAHKATYRVLISALLACGKAEQALEVCKMLAQKQGRPGKSNEKSGKGSRRNVLQEDGANRKTRKHVQCYLTLIASSVIMLLLAYFVYPFMYPTGVVSADSTTNSIPSSTTTKLAPTETPVTPIKPTPFIDESALTEADIFSPDKTGRRIVELCIDKLKSPEFNMPDDNQFLKRVAYVMSEFGKNMKYNGGIWQVTPTAFEDTMDTRAHKRLPRKYQQIWNAFKIDWKSVKYKDLDKPFYSALAARLYLSNFPEYIPPAHELQQQAEYWKFRYMVGSGDMHSFIDKANELERSV